MLLMYCCKMMFQLIKKKGFTFDVAFTSVLKRAIKTLYLIQEGTDMHWIPVYRSWRLNERHYGGLQGLNKAETAAKHGEEQVKVSSILWLSNWAVNELWYIVLLLSFKKIYLYKVVSSLSLLLTLSNKYIILLIVHYLINQVTFPTNWTILELPLASALL